VTVQQATQYNAMQYNTMHRESNEEASPTETKRKRGKKDQLKLLDSIIDE
jgi:hypothetical protein